MAGVAPEGEPRKPGRGAPPTAVIKAVKSLVELPPGPGPRFWIAVRSALSISVPFAVCTLLGHEGVGLQSAAGAFIALFGASLAAAERAKVLPFVGAGLLGSAALGALLAPSPVWLLIGLVVVAVVTAALCFAFRVGPPGPVFFVLSYGLAGNATALVDGQRMHSPLVLLLALSGGALFSYLLALLPLLRASERARPVRSLRELLPGPWLEQGEGLLLIRVFLVAVSGTLVTSIWFDPHRAYWTVSAGVAVIGLTAVRRYSFGRGLHRTTGTLVGAGLYLAITPLGTSPLVLIVLLALLQFMIELVVVRNYALALVFITPLVLLISGAAMGSSNLMVTAGERVLDTLIGSALAAVSALLHRKGKKWETSTLAPR